MTYYESIPNKLGCYFRNVGVTNNNNESIIIYDNVYEDLSLYFDGNSISISDSYFVGRSYRRFINEIIFVHHETHYGFEIDTQLLGNVIEIINQHIYDYTIEFPSSKEKFNEWYDISIFNTTTCERRWGYVIDFILEALNYYNFAGIMLNEQNCTSLINRVHFIQVNLR